MNRENLEVSWPEISEKLLNRFPKLTQSDVNYVKGHEEDLLKRIEVRLQKNRLDLLKLISTL